jgi:hypothetical protein
MKHQQSEFAEPLKSFKSKKSSGKYGRLFPGQNGGKEITDSMKKEMEDLAGIMYDAPNKEINSNKPAGYTYLGQFIVHDMSFDPTSIRDRQADPNCLRNFRTPALDLESVYGGGPTVAPYLYTFNSNNERIRFLLSIINEKQEPRSAEPPHRFYDLPRLSVHPEGIPEDKKEFLAVIPDPRNDENFFISQLHVAFMRLHNYFEEKVATDIRGEKRFLEAQRQLIWHFQYVVIHDYLTKIVDPTILKQKVPHDKETVQNMKNLRYFKWQHQPFIPFEFSGAIFRFGHSQVRSSYEFNDYSRGSVFEKRQGQLPKTYIDWKFFFSSKADLFFKIDPSITKALFNLPQEPNPKEKNLIYRNLIRGLYYDLPSGQFLVQEMELTEYLLDKERLRAESSKNFTEFEKIEEILPQFLDNTPLWYYTLLEAKIFGQEGDHVGPVASHIIAEVIIGLIQSDETSYLYTDPSWVPRDEKGKPINSMADLLTMAGVFHGTLEPEHSNPS